MARKIALKKATDKETGRLLDAAERGGWTIKAKQDGWMLLSPDKKNSVMVHVTSSDWRSHKNTISKLRRYGLKI